MLSTTTFVRDVAFSYLTNWTPSRFVPSMRISRASNKHQKSPSPVRTSEQWQQAVLTLRPGVAWSAPWRLIQQPHWLSPFSSQLVEIGGMCGIVQSLTSGLDTDLTNWLAQATSLKSAEKTCIWSCSLLRSPKHDNYPSWWELSLLSLCDFWVFPAADSFFMTKPWHGLTA
jgi:hypothetical protein